MARKIAREQEILQEARDQHAPGRGLARSRKERRERERHHHREIEEDRGGRGAGKAMHHVEHAAIERHQRDQEEIRECDAGELDREIALALFVAEPGRQQAHHLRHEGPGDDQQDDLRDEQQREDAVGKQPCRLLPFLPMDMRIGRHEGGVECALGENGAEMVGKAEGDEEGVCDGTGAQDRREHDIACETGQPRKQGIAADSKNAPKHGPLSSVSRGASKRRNQGLLI